MARNTTLESMTSPAPAAPRWRVMLRAVAARRITAWVAFALVHLWLGHLSFHSPASPFGDVLNVYRGWAEQAVYRDYWVGIDAIWVYPIVALVPIMAAALFGFTHYGLAWLVLVTLLDAVAFGFLLGRGRPHLARAWWWLAFLMLLGPIALDRIDSVTVPIAIVAVVLFAAHPRVGAFLLVIGTWIKIWPAAVLLAIVVASRHRGAVIATAVGSSIAIVVLALAFGSGTNVLSFVTEQTGRGLQIEAPVSTPWMWLAYAGVAGAAVNVNVALITYEVSGPGVEIASALTTPLMAAAIALIVVLGVIAVRRGASSASLLPVLSLALVTALIVFNKVGSPQFISWLAVPLLFGLAASAAGAVSSFRTPATMGLLLAFATQGIYPNNYDALLMLNPIMLVLLTGRNLLLIALLGWAIASLWSLARARVSDLHASATTLSDAPLTAPATHTKD